MRFMNSSLENLVKSLPEDKLEYLSQEFTGKQLELLKQKGIYPYEYMKAFEMFDQKIHVKKTKPGKIDFHISLKDDHISHEDYKNAMKV